MKKLIVSALLGATAMIAATPSYAGDSEGKLQIKVLAEQEQRSGFKERYFDRPFFNKGKSGYGRSMLSPQQIQRILDAHAPMMERFGYLESGAFDE